MPVSSANLRDWIDRNRTFQSMAGGLGFPRRLAAADGTVEQIPAMQVSTQYFDVLGLKPILGRTFLPSDVAMPPNAAVISEGLWRTRFGADRGVIGRTVRLDEFPFTILGVVPADAQRAGGPSSVWTLWADLPGMDTRGLHFFRGIGVPLFELYGMSESTGPATSNLAGQERIGSVGRPIPGVEIVLADDGEILMRGGVVTGGYYKMPEETAETFDSDGFLHSGDLGRFDDDGFLHIVGRKKDIIINAAGKNIAPAKLETAAPTNRPRSTCRAAHAMRWVCHPILPPCLVRYLVAGRHLLVERPAELKA